MKTKKKRNLIRSSLSGKIINGKEVIMAEEAEEYLKKMGYEIKKEMSFKEALEKAIGFSILAFSFILLIPLISAATPTIFTFDFDLRQNQIIMVLLFSIAGVLYWKENTLFSGTLIIIGGILMAFNSINLIVSLIIIAVGLLILTQEGRG